MNIYFQELKFYRRSTIIWIIVLSLGVFGYLSIFSSFTQDISAAMKLLENFPAPLREALGIRPDIFFTVFGFMAYLLTFLWMIMAIQSMNLGTGIVSKEISGKTADFLLSKPVSRFKVFTSKLLASLTLIVITNLIVVPVAFLSALTFSNKPFDADKFFILTATTFFVQLFFLALGFLVSVIVPKIKSVVAYSLPIVLGFFVVGLLDGVINSEQIRYLTPFKYFDPIYILSHKTYDPKYLIVEAVFVVACIVTAYVIYLRKDVRAPA